MSTSAGTLSTPSTDPVGPHSRARIAVVHPEPEPTSSTRSPSRTSSSSSMARTVLGCEFVCPWPIGSAVSARAKNRWARGRNDARGTALIASRTRSAVSTRPVCRRARFADSGCGGRAVTLGPMSGESVFPALEPLLEQVSKPIQYVGGELNSTVKDWDCGGFGPAGDDLTVRWALMYPDAYEVGVPNQGVMILYEVLNERPDALAERTYAVWPDLERLMREASVPQFTVDAHRSVRDFDLFGISFSTELGYTNMLTALDLAGIPLHAVDRTDADPVVIAGGHAAFNPETIADFIDAAIVGDGEQAVLTVTDLVAEWKAQGRPGGRRELLLRLARTGGVYVPAFYDVDYLPDGRIKRVAPKPEATGVPWRVAKHTVTDLDEWPYPKQPLVPLAESVHERMSVEIFRGCTRGCRFCQAGMITRPVRERSITGIGEMVERGLAATGFEEVGPALAVAPPTTARSPTSPRAWPTATRAPRPACRCRRPGSTRSTSTSPTS